MFPEAVRRPILALSLLSLGGLLLHVRVHDPSKDLGNLVPLLCGLATAFGLPFLFARASTVGIAYVLNWVAVILGTVTMALFSVNHWQDPVTLGNVLLKSTLADILVLWAKVPLGGIVLQHFREGARSGTRSA